MDVGNGDGNYLEYIDNEVWKVIQNGNSKKRVTKGKDGVYRVLPSTIQEEQFAEEKERKARTLLVNVNTGHGNVSSGSVHVNSGTQFKSGASRFNTGKVNVNSGSVNVNSARVTRPVSNQTSYKSSPKFSQVNLTSPKKCFSKQSSPVNRPFSRYTAYKSNKYAVKGKMGTAVKTSAGCVWRKAIPLSKTNSGPTPDSTVNVSRGPQGRPKPVKAWVPKRN
ncbi:hypothetical protein Tco_1577282 [Tanacetum coccineum]